ncbi:hypothetical protein EYR40_004314 [Pleurotus pulmonarius]|nr:hypothetical protein EYR40_004314 [Pleurotus pulmonarius]KAF4607016.1 hypothetical protein EYR38_001073 [Pleurotus pulmonarius]
MSSSSPQEKPTSIIPLVSRALHRIRSTPPRIIASPPTQPRRAAVAIIIRVVPSPDASFPALQPGSSTAPVTLSEFFDLEWVNDPKASPEILFLERENTAVNESTNERVRSSRKVKTSVEKHVAFPGGRTEEGDEGGLYTAMRQTWEEIGIDLAEKHYACVGQLDDREITTSLGKRLLMILSPHVFLQLSPSLPPSHPASSLSPPPPDPAPNTTLHWTPLESLVSKEDPPRWSTVTVDAASRLASKHSSMLRILMRCLVGSMEFPSVIIEPGESISSTASSNGAMHENGNGKSPSQDVVEKGMMRHRNPRPQLKLWGLSLGMVLDLMSYMILPYPTPSDSPSYNDHSLSNGRITMVAPSLASVFPRFSYPDVNFWIWVFGRRYREVVRGWEESVKSGGTNDRRINWSGSALSTYYAAIRKALVVVIAARALGILAALLFTLWWTVRLLQYTNWIIDPDEQTEQI